ncbi:hypothetical protein POM88_025030 [Heracleum sosnowskyi]|uniref:Myb/SANT-like domain-containing protein n=1 Tax=Heracleum sosnowskyi TaxID=360622 RepID=A0AAD8MM28_9APIA|nr:hypothetical protein POM88_025030 [Heracleum sosnowskyi]
MATTPVASPNAKWTDELHKLFVELCAAEVIKGNKAGTTLNKEAWVAVHTEFVRQKNVPWTIRQFKNHWEVMKPDYDTLFGDIVATGQRARAANTYSAVNLEVGEEFTEVMGEEDEGKEGSGDSDDNNIQSPPNLFPSASHKPSKSSGSKRKRSGAEFVREGLDSLTAAMSYRSTQTSAATDDAALNAAVDLLDNMEQVPPGSELYFYARRYLLDKGNRTLFLKARSNELRYGELMYNFTRRAGPN